MYIRDALVVILGIGKYDGMEDLIGVEKDYKNILHTFYNQFSYSVVFMDDNDKFHYCNLAPKYKNPHEKKLKSKPSFKIEWTEDEIDDFLNSIQKIVNKNRHDSILFFISSHGDQDGVILDSDCTEVQLIEIFNTFFGEGAPFLLDKPKLFFIDACRGSMKSRIDLKDDEHKTKGRHGNKDKDKNITFRGKEQTDKKENKEIKEKNEKKESDNNDNDNDNDNKDSDNNSGNPNLNDNNSNSKSVNGKNNKGKRNRAKSKFEHDLSALYHNEANCRFIYANPDGYAAVDAGKNGGYLIQSVKHVFCRKESVMQHNLDDIVNQIRSKTRQLVGTAAMENVQDVNHMNFIVYFDKRAKK